MPSTRTTCRSLIPPIVDAYILRERSASALSWLSANRISPIQVISTAYMLPSSNVYNLNFLDGQMYQARDPLLGPTGYGGNFLTRLGDLLAPDYASVVIVPIAHGGTSIDDWSPLMQSYVSPRSGCHWRLIRATTTIEHTGIEVTAILWQQGEFETLYHNHDSELYIQRFLGIAAAIRRMGLAAPIYVAQCTRTPEGLNEPIRQAQRDLAGYPGIKAGPDIDSVTERTADGHLTSPVCNRLLNSGIRHLSLSRRHVHKRKNQRRRNAARRGLLLPARSSFKI